MPIQKRVSESGHISYGVTVYNKYLARNQWVGTFERKRDAQAAELEAKRRIQLGKALVERKDIGFSDMVDKWLELKTVNLRANTQSEYRHTTNHLREYFRNRPVSAIDKESIYNFVVWISRKGLSASYVRKIVTRLSQVLKTAIELGYLTENPLAAGVSNLPEMPGKRIEPLTPEELRTLVDSIPPYWRPAVLVMATCGLRIGEVFGLRLDDVDLERGLLRVRKQLAKRETAPTKTPAGVRIVPLVPTVAELLRSHIASVPFTEADLLFPTENGCAVRLENWRKRVWFPAVEQSGLQEKRRITPHDLRRTFASAQALHGRSLGYLQSVMGHKNATTTFSYYVGVYGEEQLTAVKDMEEWLAREEATATWTRAA